jgi:hypothetical protein
VTEKVRGFLVTVNPQRRIDLWMKMAYYSNWLDARINARGTETWHVMVVGEAVDEFLAAARDEGGITIEEIIGAGDNETFELRVGEPGTGWRKP